MHLNAHLYSEKSTSFENKPILLPTKLQQRFTQPTFLSNEQPYCTWLHIPERKERKMKKKKTRLKKREKKIKDESNSQIHRPCFRLSFECAFRPRMRLQRNRVHRVCNDTRSSRIIAQSLRNDAITIVRITYNQLDVAVVHRALRFTLHCIENIDNARETITLLLVKLHERSRERGGHSTLNVFLCDSA